MNSRLCEVTEVLTNLSWWSFHNIYMYPIITLYTLNSRHVTCQWSWGKEWVKERFCKTRFRVRVAFLFVSNCSNPGKRQKKKKRKWCENSWTKYEMFKRYVLGWYFEIFSFSFFPDIYCSFPSPALSAIQATAKTSSSLALRIGLLL